MKNMKKFMALALALVMVLGLSANVFAATSDPHLTNAYDTLMSYTVPAGVESEVMFSVVPATSAWVRSGFDAPEDEDEEAALLDAVVWTTDTPYITEEVEFMDYSWADAAEEELLTTVTAVFSVSEATPAGVYMVTAKNTLSNPANAEMLFTVVVDSNNPADASATGVKYEIYTSNTILAKSGTLTDAVVANNYYGTTSYVSALDVIPELKYENVINAFTVNSLYHSLDGMKIDGINYDMDYNTYEGWQYRVYNASGALMPVSANVGMDVMKIGDGYTVVLKYGAYGAVTFPTSLVSGN